MLSRLTKSCVGWWIGYVRRGVVILSRWYCGLRGSQYPEDYDFTKFLPEFREKGVVTAINRYRILLYSTHNY